MKVSVKNKIISILIMFTLVLGMFPTIAFAEPNEPEKMTAAKNLPQTDGNLLRMWYKAPAANWNNYSLAIGNGYMGGLVFGSISRERVHFNDKTLWSGGPTGTDGTGGNYRGGNRATAVDPAVLETFRKQLDNKSQYVWGYSSGTSTTMLSQMWGAGGMGAWQDSGDIYLDFAKSGLTADNQVTNYVRDLDMNTAISSVNYDYSGVHYTREYFCSYPDNVMVMRLTASEKGKLTFDASISDARTTGRTITAAGDTITLKGSLSGNGLRYEAQLKVINDGGDIAVSGSNIAVTGADEVVLVFACGTDYKNEYPTYRTKVDPHDEITERLTTAAAKPYDELLEAHLDDHQALFSRVSVDLNHNVPDKPTDELVAWYRSVYNKTALTAAERADMNALEIMCYQFGRYLGIAGSRDGALPTNLGGAWWVGTPAWNGDYHFNVNVQENYWPLLAANLAECVLPFNDFMESLREPGRVTAEYSHGVKSEPGEANGFIVHTTISPMGHTAPNQSQEYGWNMGGVDWALETVYDYYLFTGDEEYLRDKIYPMLKEQATFWEKFLWYSEYQDRMTVAPSISPEQGPTVNGTTYDQSIVWQTYENIIQAAGILGVDADKIDGWRKMQSMLKPIQIGDAGQIKEWFEETTPGRAKAGNLAEVAIPNWNAGNSGPHRHNSHLVGLYPGTVVNKDNKEYIEAAKVSLEQRAFGGSGWSKGWKIALWARTLDADNTHRMVRSMVSGTGGSDYGASNIAGFTYNLFDIHGAQSSGVYQIDGNFGYTAGVNEMFLQSQLGYTQFLPAIPEAWDTGSVKGLVARGNFVIDMIWSANSADKFTVTAKKGGLFTGEYAGIANAKIKDSDGVLVEFIKISNDKISFDTVKDGVYTIEFDPEGKLLDAIQKAVELRESLTAENLSTIKADLGQRIEHAISVKDGGDPSAMLEELLSLTGYCKVVEAALPLSEKLIEAEDVFLQVGENMPETYQSFSDAIKSATDLLKSDTIVIDKISTEISNLNAVLAAYKTLVEAVALLGEKVKEAEGVLLALDEISGDLGDLKETVYQGLSDAISSANALLEDNGITISKVNAELSKLNIAMAALNNLKPTISPSTVSVGSTITLTAPYNSLDIRFTLDGSAPSARSFLYTEPFEMLGDAVQVTAALFIGNYRIGTVVSSNRTSTPNIAPTAAQVVASTEYGGSYEGNKATDGNYSTRWATPNGTTAATLELTFANPVTVVGAGLSQYASTTNYTYALTIDWHDGESWVPVYSYSGPDIGGSMSSGANSIFSMTFGRPATSDRIRLNVTNANNPTYWEFQLIPLVKASIDRTELNAALDEAEEVIADGRYAAAEDTKEAFDTAYAAALSVNERFAATQEEVDKSAEALLAALESLKTEAAGKVLAAARELLIKTIEKAEGLNESDYTAENWTALQEILTAARKVRDNPDATKLEIDQAVSDLVDAMDKRLDPIEVNKEALLALIRKAEDYLDDDTYTQDSRDALEEAIDIAKEIAGDSDVTEQGLLDAIEDLQAAIDGLYIEVTSVKIDGAAIQQVRIRNTKQFTATVNPTNATDPALTWESSNEKIFTVNDGLVKGVGTGSAKLIITSSNGKTSFIMVQITA